MLQETPLQANSRLPCGPAVASMSRRCHSMGQQVMSTWGAPPLCSLRVVCLGEPGSSPRVILPMMAILRPVPMATMAGNSRPRPTQVPARSVFSFPATVLHSQNAVVKPPYLSIPGIMLMPFTMQLPRRWMFMSMASSTTVRCLGLCLVLCFLSPSTPPSGNGASGITSTA